MDSGQTSLDDLAAGLRAQERVSVRAMLHPSEEGWEVDHLDLLVDPLAKPTRELIWRYPTRAFVRGELPGADLAYLLCGGPVQFAGFLMWVHDTQLPNATFSRYRGGVQSNPVTWPWPRTEWELTASNQVSRNTDGAGVLFAEGMPAFYSAEAAVASFFYGVGPSNFLNSRPLLRLNQVERRAWLERVTISAARLVVAVKGTRVSDSTVTVSSPTRSHTKRVGKTGRVTMPLPEGLEAGTTVMLSINDEWLDYQFYASPDDVSTPAWEDPEATLRLLIANGEGPIVEFKERLPTGNKESKRTVLKTATAFGSTGGVIVFGVSDDLEAVGVGSDAQEQLDRLVQLVREWISPTLRFDPRIVELDGKPLLVLDIHATPGELFALTIDKVEFFVRRGSSTFPARREDIAAAFRGTGQQPWSYAGYR